MKLTEREPLQMAKAWSGGSLFAAVRLPFGKVSAILVNGDIFI